MRWISLEKEMPKEEGIYLAAVFDEDKLVEFSTNYAFLEGRFFPNSVGGGLEFTPTHWMKWSEYKLLLEALPREEKDSIIL